MSQVLAIMPCRGRADQTLRNVQRLLTTAGYDAWQLVCMVDADVVVQQAITESQLPVWSMATRTRGYWPALQQATNHWPEFSLIVNLANDLIGGHQWLARAVAAYRATFGDGLGMIGFNGDHHEVGHSCHFLIHRHLLERYGGWPAWYDHTYGDTELCERAIADGVYGKAPWAMLFHDHPYFGGQDDPVYAEGRAQSERDHHLFQQRKAQGWPLISH